MKSAPAAVFPKVFLIVFDLLVAGEGSETVRQILGWNNPNDLASRFIGDIKSASHGYCNYQIVEAARIPEFPMKELNRRNLTHWSVALCTICFFNEKGLSSVDGFRRYKGRSTIIR